MTILQPISVISSSIPKYLFLPTIHVQQTWFYIATSTILLPLKHHTSYRHGNQTSCLHMCTPCDYHHLIHGHHLVQFLLLHAASQFQYFIGHTAKPLVMHFQISFCLFLHSANQLSDILWLFSTEGYKKVRHRTVQQCWH